MPAKIHEALGRLKARFPRVARYYALAYDDATQTVTWTTQAALKTRAEQLDGTYLLRTDRQDLSDEEIWRLYMLLTRVEAAFRAMKSPLLERPIFHHLEPRDSSETPFWRLVASIGCRSSAPRAMKLLC